MGKGSGIGILALIVAVGAIGLGVFTFITFSPDSDSSSAVKRTYTDFREADFTSTAEDAWYTITGISINFDVKEGESVYFLFTCTADVVPVSSVAYMHFRLVIDSVPYDNASTTVGATSSSANSLIYSVALQYADYSLSTGSHTVTVQTLRECDGEIYNCLLLVNCMISTDFESSVIIVI